MESLIELKKKWKMPNTKVVYDRSIDFGYIRVYKNESGYTLQRFFRLGEGWGISADLENVDLVKLIDKIVELARED